MGSLAIKELAKLFDDVTAVDHISFEAERGEFLSLLGPSGCGKTTTLRMIAGLEQPTSGSIFIDEKDVTEQPPYRRNTAMVFQSYALFPHMTVHNNVAFGLRMHKVEKDLIEERTRRALDLVQMVEFGSRYPHEISGGQQQRVALARAMAIEPALLLLDEPLSNLDARLREQMRIEVKLIQEKVGITTVYVTHDQEEALTMSDRVVVMEGGRIVEVGTPLEIYQAPSSAFTAEFIGNTNILNGRIVDVEEDGLSVETDVGLRFTAARREGFLVGQEVIVAIREERIQLAERVSSKDMEVDRSTNVHAGVIEIVTFIGPTIHFICRLGDQVMRVRRPNEGQLVFASGDEVSLCWSPEDCMLVKA
jgi:spermidine/putrescine ABC transporter ATP-binding subunit